MKKVISIILSFIIFISLTTLTIILNINILTKYKTIDKISSKINYLDLVNIKGKQNDIQKNYDDIYLSYPENNINSDLITKIYNQKFAKDVTTKIIYTELNYLLTGKSEKTYTIDELNTLTSKNINNIKNLSDNDKQIINNIITDNNLKILTIENIIRGKINNISYYKLKIIRYVLDYKFKIILLCLIIISIILEYIINKEKLFPYIFVPTIICSILELLIAIFLPSILFNLISNEFLKTIIYYYLKEFSNNILFTGLSILFISIFYLIINEKIINSTKKVIKPKLKKIK